MIASVYKVHRLWHWLTYGQNASALQAVAAVIASVAAVAAGIYAARAYRAANKQVKLVREQLDLQRKENVQAAIRYSEEKARLERQRKEADAKAKVQHSQMIFEEDTSRPRFRNTSSWSRGHTQPLRFENVGQSAAVNIRFTSPISGELIVRRAFIAPGEICSGTFDAAEMEEHGVLITFTNHRNTEWTVRYLLNSSTGGDEVIKVHRPWDDSAEKTA